MYAVVALQDSNEVMVAASNWLTPDKTRCYWPPFKSPDKCKEALMNRIVPSTTGKPWEMLNIHFQGEHGTWEQAQKARDAIIQTYRITGIIKRPKLENPQEMARNLLNSPLVPSTSRMPADDKEDILQMLKEIKSRVNENSIMLKQLLNKESPVSDPAPTSTSTHPKTKCNLNLPLKTLEDVERAEQELINTAMRKKYIKYLSGLGGFGPKDVVKNIMQGVLIDDLAVKFNWQGRCDKRPLSSLALADAIQDAAFNRNITRENSQAEIKKYLGNIVDRINRKRLREAGLGAENPNWFQN